MSAAQVIREIKELPLEEQREVIEFAYRFDAERMLTGKELAALAQQMIEATDAAEKLRLRDAILRGFYGRNVDAQN